MVVGGGLGGICAALKAAELGQRVLLVEAASKLGGTALHSGGAVHIWGAESWDEYRAHCPTAPELARTLVEEFRTFVDWLSSSGARGSYATVTFRGVTVPKYQIGDSMMPDAKIAWFSELGRRLERLGGTILFETRARELLREDGVVVGVACERNGRKMSVAAREVILASGGFQRDGELLRTYVGPAAAEIVPRAVPEAVGDALRMAVAVGAALTPAMGSLYGQLMPAPPCEIRWSNFLDPLLLSAFYASHSIVVNSDGERFMDEGPSELNGEVLDIATRQPPGGLWAILDEAIRREHAVYELPPGSLRPRNLRYSAFLPYFRAHRRGTRPSIGIDGLRLSRARGATVVVARTIEELVEKLAGHGLDPVRLGRTIRGYNSALADRSAALDVPSTGGVPLVTRPYHAIKLAPGVSMTYGGIAIDSRARVLNTRGAPIPGLRAVPGAAGGVHDRYYGGMLASCGVFGMIAGAEAASGPASLG